MKPKSSMKPKRWVLLAILLPALFFTQTVRAQEAFYKDKTIRFVVGFAPGGGYDLWARVVARHMGKYIPGNPTILVQNMPGAGSLLAANYIYSASRPDGLTVGIWNGAFVLYQALGDPAVKFDSRKLGWIGAPGTENPVCAIMGFTGLRTFKDILESKKELNFPSTRAGSTYDDLPRLLNETVGTKFKVISGYGGTGVILPALARREADGACWTWGSMRTTARDMLDAKSDDRLIPFLIHRQAEDPEVKNIPLISEVIRGEEDLAVYRAWAATYDFQRPFSVRPDVPRERLGILRKAFAQTFKDTQFLAEAERLGLEPEYISGEEIEKHVEEILRLSPRAKERMQFLIPGK